MVHAVVVVFSDHNEPLAQTVAQQLEQEGVLAPLVRQTDAEQMTNVPAYYLSIGDTPLDAERYRAGVVFEWSRMVHLAEHTGVPIEKLVVRLLQSEDQNFLEKARSHPLKALTRRRFRQIVRPCLNAVHLEQLIFDLGVRLPPPHPRQGGVAYRLLQLLNGAAQQDQLDRLADLIWEDHQRCIRRQLDRTPPSQVFISYARADSMHAELVAGWLRSAGYGVFIDREDPRAGRSILDKLGEALTASQALVLLWSRASAASGWVKLEIGSAISDGRTVIPVLLDDAELSPLLRGLIWIKLHPTIAARRQLISSLPRPP